MWGNHKIFRGLAILSIGSIIFLNPFFLAHQAGDGDLSPILTFFSYYLCLSCAALGVTLLIHPTIKGVYYSIVIIVFLICGFFSTLLSLDILSEVRLSTTKKEKSIASSHSLHLSDYSGTNAKALHPAYYFFFNSFPQTPVVSVTQDGFRGPGPTSPTRGVRQLGFVVGGSVAFGYGATSDTTTISGFLNQIQDEIFFVNAGVPSWNSFQEFLRFALELLDYEPAYLIVIDGYNDVMIDYSLGELFPAGTVESYDVLHRMVYGKPKHKASITRRIKAFLVDKIEHYNEILVRHVFRSNQLGSVIDASNIEDMQRHTVQRKLNTIEVEVSPHPQNVVKTGNRYLKHITLIHQIAKANGVDVLFAWQPNLGQHENIPQSAKDIITIDGGAAQNAFLKEVHQYIFSRSLNGYAILDLSNMFDTHINALDSSEFFIDRVHLTDIANRFVAQRLLKAIQQRATSQIAN